MRNFLTALFFVFSSLFSIAQSQDPVVWTASYKPAGDKDGVITVTGVLQKGWHTYSMRPTDAGPIPTSVTFTPAKGYSLEGKVTEEGASEELDPAFDAKLFVFHEKARFTQKVRLNSPGPVVVPVSVEYMACNNMMCLPPKTVTLQVKLQQ